jgi:hypothetical protein
MPFAVSILNNVRGVGEEVSAELRLQRWAGPFKKRNVRF